MSPLRKTKIFYHKVHKGFLQRTQSLVKQTVLFVYFVCTSSTLWLKILFGVDSNMAKIKAQNKRITIRSSTAEYPTFAHRHFYKIKMVKNIHADELKFFTCEREIFHVWEENFSHVKRKFLTREKNIYQA